MKFVFKDSNIINAPGYINSPEFSVPKIFAPFVVIKKTVTPKTQMEWFETIIDDEHGWVSFVCGNDLEQLRLFAYCIGGHFAKKKQRVEWVRTNGARWFPRDTDKTNHLYIMDSFLTFPSQTSDKEAIVYDYVRAGNIFDMTNRHRGRASTIVLCPKVTPEQAAYHLSIKPDFMFYLSSKKADTQEF